MLVRVFDGDLRGGEAISSMDRGALGSAGASMSSILRIAGGSDGERCEGTNPPGPPSTSSILLTGERTTPAGLRGLAPDELGDRALFPSSKATTARRSSSSADSKEAMFRDGYKD